MSENKTYKIRRSGKRTLKFVGMLIGSEMTPAGVGRDDRWTIYETSCGRYVAEIERLTCWEGQEVFREAAFCENAEAVEKFFAYKQLEDDNYLSDQISTDLLPDGARAAMRDAGLELFETV